jgi:hypothetical protein
VVGAVTERLGARVATVAGCVLADAGRWDPDQATANRVAGSGVVALVCRSTAPSVAHARDLVAPLRSRASRLAVLLVGEEPYGRAEVAGVLDVPVLGPLAWDRRGVSALWARGATPRWRSRTALGRSARRVLEGVGRARRCGPAERGPGR